MSASPLKKAALELTLTVGIPTALLWGASERLGAGVTLGLALAFPLTWLLAGVATKRRVDRLAAIALVGIGITGGTSLLQLDPKWIALKEGLIPSLMAAAMLLTCATQAPFLAAILDPILDRAAVEEALVQRQATEGWRAALIRGTLELSAILLASGVVSAAIAWWVLDAAPGTPAFNQQLSQVNTLGLVAVNLPVAGLATWRLSRVLDRLETITGLSIERLIPTAASDRAAP